MEIKKNIPNNTITRKLVDLDRETGNVYESINIIARRANQIATELKTELNRKLADFSSPTDTMEETFENREQIEISRYYERLPKPAIIATEEFLDDELFFKANKEVKEALQPAGRGSQGHDLHSPGAGRTVEGLAGRRILLGITGSIAAYKAAVLCRLLKCAGAEVRVVMTPLAKQFITPLTMATLSKNPILVEFFDPENGAWNSHVSLGEWADCYLIAPATANTLAKMAHGVADLSLIHI